MNPCLYLDAMFATLQSIVVVWHSLKGSAIRNDFVNDIINDRALDAIFATLKAIVDVIVTGGMAFSRACVTAL